jgi:hypothetical protein
MYRICWKSQLTGFIGNGEYMFTHDDAKECIDILNKKYPYIKHWIESNLNVAIQNVKLK